MPLRSDKKPDIITTKYILSELRGQGDRCHNPRNKRFQYYGALGYRRLWTSRMCIEFYANSLLLRSQWLEPVISRIGDVGDYTPANCRLLENEENAAEIRVTERIRVAARKNGPRRKIKLLDIETHKVLHFASMSDASRKIGCVHSNLGNAIKIGHNIKYKNRLYRVAYEK